MTDDLMVRIREMDRVAIRQANLGDLDALALLFIEGHRFHADRLPGWFRVPEGFTIEDQKSYIRTELERGDVVIFVAEVGGEAVGLAEVAMRENVGSPLAVPKKYTYVQSLVVTEAQRRGGVGSALMRAV